MIRSWESLGLTRPRRTESKYRLYSAEDVSLLKRARFLRRVRGLNAPAIAELLKREGRIQPAPDGNSGAIGGHLRQLRMKRKLSLAQVAGAAGPTPSRHAAAPGFKKCSVGKRKLRMRRCCTAAC